jgi:hypothetical protein
MTDSALHPPPPYPRDELAVMFPARKVPPGPVLIPALPEPPRTFPTLAHIADEVARRLNGRVPVLRRGVATYLGYDTFPVITIKAFNPAGGPTARMDWICACAVQEITSEQLGGLIEAAQVRTAGRGLAA